MNTSKLLFAFSLASLAFATPASAAIFTFAKFSATNSTPNVRWVNSGNDTNRTNDATFYTIANGSATAPGSVGVTFSFLDPLLAPFATDIRATYTLNATVAKNSAVTSAGGVFIQSGVSGSFSFLSTTAITLSGPGLATTTYAAGSNLLSGVFTGGSLVGSTTSGATFAAGVPGPGFTYTSDFLSFLNSVDLDNAISLSAITPALSVGNGNNKAIKSFRAVSGGQFSADPNPSVIAAVPEPATWAMMLVGFGMVGAGVRSRRKATVKRTYA